MVGKKAKFSAKPQEIEDIGNASMKYFYLCRKITFSFIIFRKIKIKKDATKSKKRENIRND